MTQLHYLLLDLVACSQTRGNRLRLDMAIESSQTQVKAKREEVANAIDDLIEWGMLEQYLHAAVPGGDRQHYLRVQNDQMALDELEALTGLTPHTLALKRAHGRLDEEIIADALLLQAAVNYTGFADTGLDINKTLAEDAARLLGG